MGWYLSQGHFSAVDEQSLLGLVARYYLAEFLAIGVAVGGAYLIYRGLTETKPGNDGDSVRGMLAVALRSRADLRIGAVAAVAYAMAYLFFSSVIVYQPTVDFQSVYGVSGPALDAAGCCGSPGTVPALVVYLLPQAHLALQILPLTAFFAVVIPILVGLNVTFASHSLRNGTLRRRAGWVGSVGVLVGLFTGCPTCAGFFLAGAVGGLGATTLAIALAPYQTLLVLVSVPLLLASPVVMAVSNRRAIRAACRVAPSCPTVLPG